MSVVGGVSAAHLIENVGVEVKNSAPIPVTVTGGGGGPQDVNVVNFPAVQAVSGTGTFSVSGTVTANAGAGTFATSRTWALAFATDKVDASGSSVAVSNFPATQAVSGTVSVGNFPATQAVSGTVAVNNFPATQNVRDLYASGEILTDQTAAGAALTFTFSSAVQLLYVQIKTSLGTGSGRADPFGGTPTASLGIPCDDGVPQAIPVQATSVKVFATAGATVSVWGYRYA